MYVSLDKLADPYESFFGIDETYFTGMLIASQCLRALFNVRARRLIPCPVAVALWCLAYFPNYQCRWTAPRRRKALLITDTELRLIASAAIIGDKSQPVKGKSTPAANGTPSAL